MKSKLKKTYSKILMVLAMIATVFTIAIVNADTPAKLSFTTIGDVSRGDTVTVKINLAGAKDFNVLDFVLNYDKDAFEYQNQGSTFLKGKEPDVGQIVKTFNNNADEGKVVFTMGFSEMDHYLDLNGEIATAVFKVKDTASGKSSFSLEKRNFAKTTNFDPTEYEHYDLDVDSMDVNVVVPVNDITLSSTDMNLIKGNTENLTITADPTDTSVDASVSIISSSDSIATATVKNTNKGVTEVGVEAKGNGDATLTVNAYGITKTVTVHVTNPITKVELSDTSIKLEKDATKDLTATITPTDTTDSKTITWTSDDESVVTVDNTGKVTAVGTGNAKITATASNGVFAECNVEVVISITGITMDETSITLNKGRTHTLNAEVTPLDTTEDKTITWESSNPTVATVNNGVVTAVSGGETTITASVLGGKFTKSVKVTVEVKLNDITLSDTNIELLPKQEKDINVTFDPVDANNKNLTWTSGDEAIATVVDGKINAKKAGTTTITVVATGADGPITKTINVKVLKPIDGMTILPNDDITLNKGAKETLGVTFTPDDAEQDKTITWESSDPTVASVNQTTGEVTALKGGTVVITGSLKNSEMKVTANITVEVAVDKVTLNESELTIHKGDTYEGVVATVSPDDATRKTVTWESSEPTVATVDVDGKITAVGDGTTVITATADGKSAQLTVKVITPVTGVTVDVDPSITLNRGESKKVNVTITPNDATDKSVTWKTSNDKVVTVDASGNISAIGAGEADITVIANGSAKVVRAGEVLATIHVKVVVPVTKFELPLNQQNLTILRGEKYTTQLTPIIEPTDATADERKITWTVDHADIVSVDENGKVTGLKEGTATVTGTLSNGMTVTCNVTVTIIPLTDIEVDIPNTILKGNEFKLNVKPIPEDTTEFENVVYESEDTDIFTVTDNGIIVGKKAGLATLRITVGGITKEYEISISEVHLEGITSLPEKTILNIGETTGIITKLNPVDTTDDITYVYKSSDESIATVDANGVITAVGEGTVKITVTANGKFDSEFEVSVVNNQKTVTSPKTYVSGYGNYLILSLISIVSIGGLILLRKKMRG